MKDKTNVQEALRLAMLLVPYTFTIDGVTSFHQKKSYVYVKLKDEIYHIVDEPKKKIQTIHLDIVDDKIESFKPKMKFNIFRMGTAHGVSFTPTDSLKGSRHRSKVIVDTYGEILSIPIRYLETVKNP